MKRSWDDRFKFKFPIGTKVWIKQKTIWDNLPNIMTRIGDAPKPDIDSLGRAFGWVRDHKRERFLPNVGGGSRTSEWINVVVYKEYKTVGGDYYRDCDLEPYAEIIDFVPEELFEI
jgi:hypothetical protein